MTLSVTRLLGLGLTPGKLRGLQRICNDNGTLTMVATDQNSSMISMLKDSFKKLEGKEREPTYDELVLAKNTLTRALAPHASAILVDGYYGAFNAMATMNLPRNAGLLIRVEKSGGGKNEAGAPLGCFERGLGVRKIKLMGCDAVKLLAPFEPSEPASAEHQFHFVKQVYEECQQHDILMLLETVAFPFAEKKDDKKYKDRKAETVIESARQLSRYCDIYKAEFPGWLGVDSDSTLKSNLNALNEASERPWVLLSAGVDYPDYVKQVSLAMECGASGILGGRAFWKEYFLQGDQAAREKFALGELAKRVKDLAEVVRSKATPWYAWYGLTKEQIASIYVAENWHYRYAEPFTATDTGKGWGY